MAKRRITIVTGANSGVGFGICQRLLSSLCHPKPSDAQPQKFSLQDFSKASDDTSSKYEGIILIMACRNVKRAESAKEKLYSLLDVYIEGLKTSSDEYIHAKKYRETVDIRIHALDLAVMNSVFQFAEEILKQYPYVTDLICNAGFASFSGINWLSFIAQLATEPIAALTTPKFYRENQGELSVDGLGWVWQCNVFAHYCIFRVLQSLLKASPTGGRVVWTSSITASPTFYESGDWQLIKTEHSYECSKYQTDLIATHLDFRARRVLDKSPTSRPIRHFISEPGVCSTNIGAALVNPGSKIIEVCLSYIVRFLGSIHHTIEPYKAAVSSVHLILAPLWFFALSSRPVRYGAETDRWGKEYVGLSPVKRWEENYAMGEVLLADCEALYQELRVQERGTMDMDV
ncbi:3-keto-steroid reductase [Leucoagaricus gongylophorus]